MVPSVTWPTCIVKSWSFLVSSTRNANPSPPKSSRRRRPGRRSRRKTACGRGSKRSERRGRWAAELARCPWASRPITRPSARNLVVTQKFAAAMIGLLERIERSGRKKRRRRRSCRATRRSARPALFQTRSDQRASFDRRRGFRSLPRGCRRSNAARTPPRRRPRPTRPPWSGGTCRRGFVNPPRGCRRNCSSSCLTTVWIRGNALEKLGVGALHRLGHHRDDLVQKPARDGPSGRRRAPRGGANGESHTPASRPTV